MLEDRKYMPKGAVTFAQLTPNAIYESAVSGKYFNSMFSTAILVPTAILLLFIHNIFF